MTASVLFVLLLAVANGTALNSLSACHACGAPSFAIRSAVLLLKVDIPAFCRLRSCTIVATQPARRMYTNFIAHA